MFHSAVEIPITVKKSLVQSTYSHKLIQLPNGLRGLLISSPSLTKASCAIAVAAGSFCDPPDVLGLAHLCEHMLFSGTKDFPNPSAFLDLLNKYGGQSNAFTTGERTCYYFECPVTDAEIEGELVFSLAFRMFSAFFKCPTFSEKQISREVSIIQQEHDINVASIEKVMYYGLRLLANQDHPFHRFCTGTSHTLHELPQIHSINVRKKLISYFKTHYVGCNMGFVLQGPQSLNNLKKLILANLMELQTLSKFDNPDLNNHYFEESSYAGKSFARNSRSSISTKKSSEISTESSQISDKTDSSNTSKDATSVKIFDLDHTNRLLFIRGLETRIQLIFPLELETPNFYSESWCNLLGDESPSSLYHLLAIELNYISSLYVSTQNLAKNNSVILLDLYVTKKGLSSIYSLFRIIVFHLQKLITLPLSYLAKYLSQFLTTKNIGYFYQEAPVCLIDSLCEIAEKIVSEKKKLSYDNLLIGTSELDEDKNYTGEYGSRTKDYWHSKAERCLMYARKTFDLKSLNIIINHQSIQVIGDLIDIESNSPLQVLKCDNDENFNFDYKIFSFGYSKLLNTQNIPLEILQLGDPQMYPKANKFVFHSQEEIRKKITGLSGTSTGFETSAIEVSEPDLLLTNTCSEVWFRRDLRAGFTSKSTLSLQIQSMKNNATPLSHMCIEIICRIFGSRLKSSLYHAELVGYKWGIYPITTGSNSIGLTVSGVNIGLVKIVELVVRMLKAFMLTDLEKVHYRELMKARVKIRKEYTHLRKENGISQAVSGSMVLLNENVWPLDERVDSLEMVDVDDLVEQGQMLWNEDTYMEILITGDCEKDFAMEIAEKVLNMRDVHKSSDMKLDPLSSFVISSGTNFLYETINLNSEDPSHTLYTYIQFGLRDCRHTYSLAEAISFYVSIHAGSELRSKKQLGYTVLCNSALQKGVVGMCLIILSGTHGGTELMSEVEIFLNKLHCDLMVMSEGDFRGQILHPFLEICRGEQPEEILPHNPWHSIAPCEKSTNFDDQSREYLEHRNIWEKIFNKNYGFRGKMGHDEIDTEYLSKLTRQQFAECFGQVVSPSSRKRATLTIVVSSNMDKEAARQHLMRTQVRALLEHQDVVMGEAELDELLRRCDYDFTHVQARLLSVCRVKNHRLKRLGMWVKRAVPKRRTAPADARLTAEYLTISTVEDFHRQCTIARQPGRHVKNRA